ncbi:MAG TPA: K(+)-transporting ATPase subunit C [Tepidisphaeraceae bacterium]|nr:K(+)-transporting ATPase subunit C [Tepidisphaeraceae bacterium]
MSEQKEPLHIGRELAISIVAVISTAVLVCGVYPLIVWGIAQLAFPFQANGSMVADASGTVVGSRLIGQSFAAPKYFHPRPSDAGNGYDPTQTGGSNLGPTSAKLMSNVAAAAAVYRAENNLPSGAEVPVDAVTASGSGCDPHISVANARLQAPRVAKARGMSLDQVLQLIDQNTDGPGLGFLGEPGVNVLSLNLALDKAGH